MTGQKQCGLNKFGLPWDTYAQITYIYVSMPDWAYKVRCADWAKFHCWSFLAFGIWHCPSSWQVHNFSINASSCKQTANCEETKQKKKRKKMQEKTSKNNRRPGQEIVMWPTWQALADALSGSAVQQNQLRQKHLNANANGHKAWGCSMRALCSDVGQKASKTFVNATRAECQEVWVLLANLRHRRYCV